MVRIERSIGEGGSDWLGTECKEEEGIRWRRRWTDGTRGLDFRVRLEFI